MSELFYESELDKQMEILSLKTSIEIDSAISRYCFENAVSDNKDSNSDNGLKNIVEKVTTTILNFLRTVVDTIRNAFTFKEGAKLEDYAKSDDFQVKYAHDLEEVERTVNKKVREGSELIQKISRGTHIPDTVVNAFVHDGPKTIAKIGPVVIGGGLAIKYYNKYSNDGFIKTLSESVNHIKETAKAPDKKAKDQIASILQGMFSVINSGATSIVEGMNAVSRESNRIANRKK